MVDSGTACVLDTNSTNQHTMDNILHQIRKDAEEAKAKELTLAITKQGDSKTRVYLGILLLAYKYRRGVKEDTEDAIFGIWVADQVLEAGHEAVKQAEARLLAVAKGEA